MRLRNTTDVPDELLREIIRVVRPSGIKNFDVMIKNSSRGLCGRAYSNGAGYHARACPFIVVRIPKKLGPIHHHYGGEGSPKFWTYNKEEGIVALVAHELRHLWQFKKRKNRKGYFPKTRGVVSERDCECWALNRLRAWRRRNEITA